MNRFLRAIMNRTFGAAGENSALEYLKGIGYRELGRGYRTRYGEIDLIMRDGDGIVFVEVKSRREGHPEEAVDEQKQRKLTLTALQYLKNHKLLDISARFDVVALVWPETGKAPTIRHYKAAFEAVGRGQMFR